METPFEEVLEKMQPLVSHLLRKNNVYKNHDEFRQAANIAIWRAWQKFDENNGTFASYAYQYIQGAILRTMTAENKQNDRTFTMEDDVLMKTIEQRQIDAPENDLAAFAPYVTKDELALLYAIYVEGHTNESYSQKIGLKKSTVEKRRLRLLQRLRKQNIDNKQ